jgi:hypothetical protein
MLSGPEILLGLLERLVAFEEADRQYDDKMGETYPNIITLSNRIVKIDIVEGKHQNIPPNESIDIPNCPVRRVIVYNSGATNIGFTTSANLYVKSDTNAGLVLLPGEVQEVESKRNTIRRVNVVAPSGTGEARVTFIV